MKKWLFILAILCFTFVNAQETPPARKKVGLVLSGGGAKGFAHIGVLRVIEEAGVQIDYIGGTSMGAVVGGLYASGYTATQIDSIFRSTNFDELLNDYIPRQSKTYFERRNDEIYAITLPFKKFKVGIPRALSKGLYNYNLLSKLTSNVRHVQDFSKLPIPFLCIATDIETGQQVVIKEGQLPLALLASSAFPSLFAPVTRNGKMLIDGGVINNYPIEEVRKMGAEIIIGVDVQDGLKDRKALDDATRILVQISNMGMIERMKEKALQTDIYVKPEVSEYSVISFDQGQAIIRAGEEAAFAVFEQLKAVASKPKFVKAPLILQKDSILLGKVVISKLKNYTRAYVMGKLKFKPDTQITYEEIRNGINNLNATQNFSEIEYHFKEANGRDDLILEFVENANRTFLKFGVHYDGLFKSAVLLNVTNKKTFFKNDVLVADAIIGDNLRFNFDYYIDNGFYWSYGFRSRFNAFNRNATIDFNDGRLFNSLNVGSLNIDFENWLNQAYIQTLILGKLMIGGGLEHQNIRIKSETLVDSAALFEQSNYYSVFGFAKVDNYDNKYFPKSGWGFNGEIQHLFHSTNYTQQFAPFSIAKGTIGFATRFFPRTTLKVESEAGFAIGERTINFFDFTFGGFGFTDIVNIKPFYGYNFLSLSADSFVKATFTFDYEFLKKHHLNFAANYMNLGDKLFQNEDWISTPRFSGYALGYGLETVIGPAQVKGSWSPETKQAFAWFSVGFVF